MALDDETRRYLQLHAVALMRTDISAIVNVIEHLTSKPALSEAEMGVLDRVRGLLLDADGLLASFD